ncbi:hypothetical protein [Parabacteroides sp.]
MPKKIYFPAGENLFSCLGNFFSPVRDLLLRREPFPLSSAALPAIGIGIRGDDKQVQNTYIGEGLPVTGEKRKRS